MKNSISALLLFWVIITIFGCNQAELLNKQKNREDSIRKDSIKRDSIGLSNLKIKSKLNFDDKSVIVLKPLLLSKRVKIELSGETYMYHEADRFQNILNMRVLISSKSKVKDYSDFLPKFTAYQVDDNNHVKKIDQLNINLYRKSNRSFFAIENVFDYEEKETFVLWLTLEKETKGKILVCATKGSDTSFRVNQIIGSIIKK